MALKRAAFFVQTTAWVKILTCDNLLKLGHSSRLMLQTNGKSRKTVDYLLLQCNIAYAFWTFAFLGSMGTSNEFFFFFFLIGKKVI